MSNITKSKGREEDENGEKKASCSDIIIQVTKCLYFKKKTT